MGWPGRWVTFSAKVSIAEQGLAKFGEGAAGVVWIYLLSSIYYVLLPLILKQPTACLLAFNNVVTGTDDNFAPSDELLESPGIFLP